MQGSTLDEFYYLPDQYPALAIPDNQPVIDVKGIGIMVTALKKAYDGDGFILRLVNMSDSPRTASIGFAGSIAAGSMNEDLGTAIQADDKDGIVRVMMRAKEIATFHLKK